MTRPSALVLPLCLITSTCDVAPGSFSAGESQVVIEELVLEVDDVGHGVRTVVRAKRAQFDDLPGRGGGRLEGVDVTLSGHEPDDRGLDVLTASARRGAVGREGSLTLEDAEISSGVEAAMTISADTIQIDPNGAVRGQGVRALLPSP